jgi:hypothetical protein
MRIEAPPKTVVSGSTPQDQAAALPQLHLIRCKANCQLVLGGEAETSPSLRLVSVLMPNCGMMVKIAVREGIPCIF